MASGTITGYTDNQYIDAKIVWSSSTQVSSNQSTVTATLYYKRNNTGYTTSGTGTFTITINGALHSEAKYLVITENDWVAAVSHTVTVNHASDGSKSIQISASGDIPATSLSYTVVSGTAVLDTIPRASAIASASNTVLGSVCSVKWTPLSSNFRYKLTFSIGSWSHTTGVVYPASTSLYTYGYTLPLDAAKQLPDAKSGSMTVTLFTYSDSSGSIQVGSSSAKTITVTVPENEDTKPTVSMILTPVSTLNEPYNSLYIQGYSKVKAFVVATTKLGAKTEASSITVNGINYDASSMIATSDILTQSGKVTIKATAKDSRGYYGTYYKDIEVIPYSKPYVRAKSGESSIICGRCDASANFTDSGTYLKIKAKVVYSKVVSGGVQNNYAFIKFRYRKEGGSYSAWQTILDCKTNNSDEVITPPLLGGLLDITNNYQVQIIATDDLYESEPITISVPSDDVYMDRPAGGKSMGLGGYSSGDGRLDVYWKTMARGGLSLFDSKGAEIPLDSTMPLPRDQVSDGWNPDNLECGVYAVTNSRPLKYGDTVIMYNGVLIQLMAYVGGNVKVQLALTSDETRSPYYRVNWYGNWGNWRSFKL